MPPRSGPPDRAAPTTCPSWPGRSGRGHGAAASPRPALGPRPIVCRRECISPPSAHYSAAAGDQSRCWQRSWDRTGLWVIGHLTGWRRGPVRGLVPFGCSTPPPAAVPHLRLQYPTSGCSTPPPAAVPHLRLQYPTFGCSTPPSAAVPPEAAGVGPALAARPDGRRCPAVLGRPSSVASPPPTAPATRVRHCSTAWWWQWWGDRSGSGSEPIPAAMISRRRGSPLCQATSPALSDAAVSAGEVMRALERHGHAVPG